ncbi:MAG: pyridoxal-phosphate dependent enzyme [Bacteroidota bacterium]
MNENCLNINFSPSLLQELAAGHWFEGGYRVFVKREDLLHQTVGGNKWRKLKYNLIEAQRQGKSGLLTFGGAYSNHLYAVAAVGQLLGLSTVGIVRGEPTSPLNATLRFAQQQGMQLHFVSRIAYRDKAALHASLAPFQEAYYFLPEGGTNALALPGCAELVEEARQQLAPQTIDYYCAACGTGGTLAGMITALQADEQALGFSVLKGDFHRQEIQGLLGPKAERYQGRWHINTDYHFGGYARHRPELIDFINTFRTRTGIPLDPVYTGKLFFGLFDLLRQGYFPKGSTILVVHSGGLQGIVGFNERFGSLLL